MYARFLATLYYSSSAFFYKYYYNRCEKYSGAVTVIIGFLPWLGLYIRTLCTVPYIRVEVVSIPSLKETNH